MSLLAIACSFLSGGSFAYGCTSLYTYRQSKKLKSPVIKIKPINWVSGVMLPDPGDPEWVHERVKWRALYLDYMVLGEVRVRKTYSSGFTIHFGLNIREAEIPDLITIGGLVLPVDNLNRDENYNSRYSNAVFAAYMNTIAGNASIPTKLLENR